MINVSTTSAGTVQQSLQQSGYAALQDVCCTGDAGVYVLSGRVPSFYMKQLAQEFARRAVGAGLIVNELTVDDPPPKWTEK